MSEASIGANTRDPLRHPPSPSNPSGIFELRLAAEMENFGTGVIGRGPAGAPLELNGATFVRMGAAMRLGGFQFFYDRTNTQSTKHTYVPGFRIPNLGQTFGMRWEFSN